MCRLTSVTACPAHDLKVDEMNVDRMNSRRSTRIPNFPQLDCSLWRSRQDAILSIIKIDPVDGPDIIASHLEVELVVDGCALRREG